MSFYIQNAATNVAILNSVISNNDGTGISITETSAAFATVMLDGLTSNSNATGVSVKAGTAGRRKTYIARSTIMGNNQGIFFNDANALVYTFGNNHIVGNNTDVVGGTLQTVGLR